MERHSNSVVFGISEDKELLETRKMVDEVLSCAAGKSVQVRDVLVEQKAVGLLICCLVTAGFSTLSVSGFDSTKILHGHPFGGCALIYRQSLAGLVKHVRTQS